MINSLMFLLTTTGACHGSRWACVYWYKLRMIKRMISVSEKDIALLFHFFSHYEIGLIWVSNLFLGLKCGRRKFDFMSINGFQLWPVFTVGKKTANDHKNSCSIIPFSAVHLCCHYVPNSHLFFAKPCLMHKFLLSPNKLHFMTMVR